MHQRVAKQPFPAAAKRSFYSIFFTKRSRILKAEPLAAHRSERNPHPLKAHLGVNGRRPEGAFASETPPAANFFYEIDFRGGRDGVLSIEDDS